MTDLECRAHLFSIVPCADLEGVNAEGVFESTSFAAVRTAFETVRFRTVMVSSARSLLAKRDSGMVVISECCEFTFTRMVNDSEVKALLDEIVACVRKLGQGRG